MVKCTAAIFFFNGGFDDLVFKCGFLRGRIDFPRPQVVSLLHGLSCVTRKKPRAKNGRTKSRISRRYFFPCRLFTVSLDGLSHRGFYNPSNFFARARLV